MIAVHADDKKLLNDLGTYTEPVEVYSAQGKCLGLFVPGNLECTKQMSAKLEAMIDCDEIRQPEPAPGPQMPHGLVLARLKALEIEVQRRNAAAEKPFTAAEAQEFVNACLTLLTKPGDQQGDWPWLPFKRTKNGS
jgi:hypothetical protein